MKELRSVGRPIDVRVEVFENCKYTAHSPRDLGAITNCEYTVESWEIVSGEDADGIERDYLNSGLEADELHAYLILNLPNGDKATFRNSHVDMHERR